MSKKLTLEEQLENEITLARRAQQWMLKMGYLKDHDNKDFDTVTVDEICSAAEILPSQWQPIKARMMTMQPALCQCYRGHYLGDRPEQATVIANNTKHLASRRETLIRQVESQAEAGLLRDAFDFLREQLGIDVKKVAWFLRGRTIRLPGIDDVEIDERAEPLLIGEPEREAEPA